MKQALVGCAGVIVADTICGPMPRLPAPGELLPIANMPLSTGGCAANVGIDLLKQGISVKLFGCIGNDREGEMLTTDLENRGVDCALLRRHPELPTSKTVVLLVAGEDRRYIHSFGANAAFNISDIDIEFLDGLRVFYFGGLYALPGINMAALAALLAECRSRGIRTVVDVVVPHEIKDMHGLATLLPHIDYFVPNDDEAGRLTGYTARDDQMRALLRMGAHTVIITRGSAGAIAGRGDCRWHAPAYALDAIDPSGSGDAFCGGIITGIVQGWDLPRMLRYASALGASAALQVGTTTSVFGMDEAETFIHQHELKIITGDRQKDGIHAV